MRICDLRSDMCSSVLVDAGVGAEEDRLGRGLVGRVALVVEHLGVAAECRGEVEAHLAEHALALGRGQQQVVGREVEAVRGGEAVEVVGAFAAGFARIELRVADAGVGGDVVNHAGRSEEHTSELQSLMRSSYAVFRLTKNSKRYYISDKELHTIF